MNRRAPFCGVLCLLMLVPLSGSAQSESIGLPVIFVHGFCDSADAILPLERTIMRSLQTLYPSSYPHTRSEEFIVFDDGKKVEFQVPKTESASYETPPANTRFFIVALDDPGKSAYESFDPSEVMEQSIGAHGDELAHIIWAIKKITKAPRVIVIGHSMGGLVARSYIESMAAPSGQPDEVNRYYSDIATLVTLDTPHGGTDWAQVSLTSIPKSLSSYRCLAGKSTDKTAMAPGSQFLSQLNYLPGTSGASELPPLLTVYSVTSIWTHPLDPDFPLILPDSDFVVFRKSQDLGSNLPNLEGDSESALFSVPNEFANSFTAQDGVRVCGKNDILHLLECVGYAAQTAVLVEDAVDTGSRMADKIQISAPTPIIVGTKSQLSAQSSKDPLVWSLLEGEEAGSIDDESGEYTAPDVPGVYHAVAIDKVHYLQYGEADLNVIADPVKPKIVDWSVSPTTLTTGGLVAISYTASDEGGSGLLRAELWRAPDLNGKPGTWTEQGKAQVLAGFGPRKVSFKDTPPDVGKYRYGTHLFAASGNQTNEPEPIEVTVDNPVPAITGLAPSSLSVGSAPQKLTINGTGFLSASEVLFGGIKHAVSFINMRKITISLSSSDLANVGTYLVVVTNSTPGGGLSRSANFYVTNGQTANEWTWISGTDSFAHPGVYGTQGVPNAANFPGGRRYAVTWTDKGGDLWLFGGVGIDSTGVWGNLNDLWEFNVSIEEWAWMSGSSTVGPYNPIGGGRPGIYGMKGVPSAANVPGGRQGAVGWVDSKSNLWLFGGWGSDLTGADGSLNDLWEFNPVAGTWAWIGGSTIHEEPGVYGTQGVPAATNVPGGVQYAVSWTDKSGNFWLFGGIGLDSTGNFGNLSALWEFDLTNETWIWMSGPAVVNQAGIYGVLGTPTPATIPGCRGGAVSWIDGNDNFWLFGGFGCDSSGTQGLLNDLWEFNPTTKAWVWIGGSSAVGPKGVYGARVVSAASNVPGAREGAATWINASGNLWLFGGVGIDSTGAQGGLNDLWEFNPAGNTWTWMGGSNTVGQSGIYGELGAPAAGNVPGSREQPASWTDNEGNFWLFGGDANGESGEFNDLWHYQP